MRPSRRLARSALPVVLAGTSACWFRSGTEGLACDSTDDCDAGQICGTQDVCAPDTATGTGTGTGTGGTGTGGSGCVDDDSFACATLIEVGASVDGTIETAGDVDYYVFETDQDGVLEIVVDPVPSAIDMDLEVYDIQQAKIGQSYDTSAGQAVFVYLLEPGDTYYVALWDTSHNASSATPYTLQVGLDTSDEHEINNTFSEAAEITVGESTNGKIRPIGDVDYFKLATAGPGVLEVAIDPVPSELALDLRIYDGQQDEIGNALDAGDGQAVFLPMLCDTGTYYLRVSQGYDNAASIDPYTLLATLDDSDVYELNGTFSDAAVIELDTDVVAKIKPRGDEDYYKFTLLSAGMLDISIDPVPAALNMELRLYDGQQAQIETMTGAAGEPVQWSVEATASGDHYLLVRDQYNDASADGTYTLRVTPQ